MPSTGSCSSFSPGAPFRRIKDAWFNSDSARWKCSSRLILSGSAEPRLV